MGRADLTPQQRVDAACARHGGDAVAEACIRLLVGEDIDGLMRELISDVHAPEWLDSETNRYWLRVWGARGLLWNWDERAVPTLRTALRDEAWRVREMAAKVVARHRVDDLQPDVAGLVDDPVPRVRAAASRAVALLAANG